MVIPRVKAKGGDSEREEDDTIPSQATLFRREGAAIGVGRGKDDIKLDTIVNYVQRTANLDDLTSVWNSLTEMGVASDIKKRWIRLYAQDLVGGEIPPELKEKLEYHDEEKIKKEREKEKKESRIDMFTVVGGKVIPDPDGELTFPRAIQAALLEKGSSTNQASEIAASFAKMNTDTLNMIIPLLAKEPPPPQDNSQILYLQQRIEQLADDKHKAEMEVLRAEMKSGQRSPENDQQVQQLSQQLSELRDELRKQELARIQEENKHAMEQMLAKYEELHKALVSISEGKQAESKYGLMSQLATGVTQELSGLRTDFKTVAQMQIEKGQPLPPPRTAEDKEKFARGFDQAIEKEKGVRQIEDELFFGKGG